MTTAAGTRRMPQPVRIAIGPQSLNGDLAVPAKPIGLVIFAHGSGSSRLSPRNRYVADVLDQHRLATLLIDLLTPDEEIVDDRTARLRFDIGLLAERLIDIAEWTGEVPALRQLAIGLFGASTGGGAALVAAAERPEMFGAIVSRGGRPDLAGPALPHVTAPTLLIVGGADQPVIELNEQAMRQMRCEMRLEIVPRATHLFEEHGALERVAALAAEWFERHLNR
jgi:putative phosphoribosyl transferase